jgi:hypothetical protein
VLPALPDAEHLIAYKVADRRIKTYISGQSNRNQPIAFDVNCNKRRIRTRYDRYAHSFISAICIAAIVVFWLCGFSLVVKICPIKS